MSTYTAHAEQRCIRFPHDLAREIKRRARLTGTTFTILVLDSLRQQLFVPTQIQPLDGYAPQRGMPDQPQAGPVAPRLSDRDAPPLPYVARRMASQRPALAVSVPYPEGGSTPPPVSVIPGVSRHRPGDAKPQLSGDPKGMFRD